MISFQTTFFAGFAIAGVSLAIIVVEVIGTWRFAPIVYRLGLRSKDALLLSLSLHRPVR